MEIWGTFLINHPFKDDYTQLIMCFIQDSAGFDVPAVFHTEGEAQQYAYYLHQGMPEYQYVARQLKPRALDSDRLKPWSVAS